MVSPGDCTTKARRANPVISGVRCGLWRKPCLTHPPHGRKGVGGWLQAVPSGAKRTEVNSGALQRWSEREVNVGQSNWVHLDVAFIHRITDKAMMVELEEGEQFWIPLSQVSEADKYSTGDCDITMSITEWFANKQGIDQ